jgi:hypothetical protein
MVLGASSFYANNTSEDGAYKKIHDAPIVGRAPAGEEAADAIHDGG